jgi:hypothetical protein
MVIDILRRIGLVVHEEPALAEAQILHEERIASHCRRAIVDDIHPPQPERLTRVQP